MSRPWWTRRTADKLERIRKSQDEEIRLIQERRKGETKGELKKEIIER